MVEGPAPQVRHYDGECILEQTSMPFMLTPGEVRKSKVSMEKNIVEALKKKGNEPV